MARPGVRSAYPDLLGLFPATVSCQRAMNARSRKQRFRPDIRRFAVCSDPQNSHSIAWFPQGSVATGRVRHDWWRVSRFSSSRTTIFAEASYRPCVPNLGEFIGSRIRVKQTACLSARLETKFNSARHGTRRYRNDVANPRRRLEFCNTFTGHHESCRERERPCCAEASP